MVALSCLKRETQSRPLPELRLPTGPLVLSTCIVARSFSVPVFYLLVCQDFPPGDPGLALCACTKNFFVR